MISSFYYEILRVQPQASLAEIKAAYHRAAKDNHPDLFPENERERYQMRMMQINEAYMALLCEQAASPKGEERKRVDPAPRPQKPPSETKAVGSLRDPAYTYYKLGFRYFSEGRRTLYKHWVYGGQRIDFSTENIKVLRLAVAALHHFHRAYGCFERVASEFPTSVWAKDASVKIYYLNRYNAIYQRICDNLSKQIAAIKELRGSREVEEEEGRTPEGQGVERSTAGGR